MRFQRLLFQDALSFRNKPNRRKASDSRSGNFLYGFVRSTCCAAIMLPSKHEGATLNFETGERHLNRKILPAGERICLRRDVPLFDHIQIEVMNTGNTCRHALQSAQSTLLRTYGPAAATEIETRFLKVKEQKQRSSVESEHTV